METKKKLIKQQIFTLKLNFCCIKTRCVRLSKEDEVQIGFVILFFKYTFV